MNIVIDACVILHTLCVRLRHCSAHALEIEAVLKNVDGETRGDAGAAHVETTDLSAAVYPKLHLEIRDISLQINVELGIMLRMAICMFNAEQFTLI